MEHLYLNIFYLYSAVILATSVATVVGYSCVRVKTVLDSVRKTTVSSLHEHISDRVWALGFVILNAVSATRLLWTFYGLWTPSWKVFGYMAFVQILCGALSILTRIGSGGTTRILVGGRETYDPTARHGMAVIRSLMLLPALIFILVRGLIGIFGD